MALDKKNAQVNFAQGLDQKTDPWQVPLGRLLALKNSIFIKGGRLTKRNGFRQLTALPDTTYNLLSTFNDNLTAVGSALSAYSAGTGIWTQKGSLQPVKLSVTPVVRSNTTQSYADMVVAPNGLGCAVYTDTGGSVSPAYKYVVMDTATGQNIVPPTSIAVLSGTVTGAPKVFLVGGYFVIVFQNVISAVPHLQYVAINTNDPTIVTSNVDISSAYSPATTGAFDGAVSSDNILYLAWNSTDIGGSVQMAYLTSGLVLSATASFAGRVATNMSVCIDPAASPEVVYAAYYDSASTDAYAHAVSLDLATVRAPTLIFTGVTAPNIASYAYNGDCVILYEVSNVYSGSSTQTRYILRRTFTLSSGAVSGATEVARSVGLASRPFLILEGSPTAYVLTVMSSTYQPTYFLLNVGTGAVVSRLAYQNGPSSYYATGLSNVTVSGSEVSIPYLFRDLIIPVNKSQGASSVNGVYAQTGINVANFNFDPETQTTSEIGSNLHITGGFLWAYDGATPTEQGFHLFPDYVAVTTSGSGGLITAQQYYYQAVYEWTDSQGNIQRSAPSIPVAITTSGATSTNTIKVATLRLTYKTANPVKIVLYRWSTAQQSYYQVTSVSSPTLNTTGSDLVTITDTSADSAIIGNSLIYTTGSVLENTPGPATSVTTLWDNRLWLVPDEDTNQLQYSKEVLEATPVEMSDQLTQFVAPTIGASGSTGPNKALYPMDDKLIIFKRNACYYISGQGPNATGTNNQYGNPVYITAAAGCDNPNSIVMTPNGIMFQSDKGIWLLGRDLQASYIGAPVEDFTNGAEVLSAINVPETNQIRFTLDSGVTLMFDYYFGQWGSFYNVPGISSVIYDNLHTFIDSYGRVFQENPGSYLDGSRPVTMSFTTGWINLAGLQGLERAYEFQLLGQYISPHKLTIDVSYDYFDSVIQSTIITPDNYSDVYGAATLYGGGSPSTYGGVSNVEQWRVFLERQKCQSFQLTITEMFDSTVGAAAGAGLTLSGLDLLVGVKKGRNTLPASRSTG